MARYKQSNTTFLEVVNDKELNRAFKALRELLQTMPEKVGKRVVATAVRKASDPFLSSVLSATPKRTGKLRSALGRSFRQAKRPTGNFTNQIGFNRKAAPHAILVEDGTKHRYTKKLAYRGRHIGMNFMRDLIKGQGKAVGDRMVRELNAGFQRWVRRELRKVKAG